MNEKKLIRDAHGSPIPQHYKEDSGIFIANTNGTGDPIGIDFGKKKLLRDAFGHVIPQFYDIVEDKFKPLTSENSGGSGGTSTKPGIRHFYTTIIEDPVDPLKKVFLLDFDKKEWDFLQVFFNGETLGKGDFEVVEDTIGDYVRINTVRPIDYEFAELQGYVFRGFEII